MFSSYRNQSVDLQSKSTDWFLCDGSIGPQKGKAIVPIYATWKHFSGYGMET